MMNDETWMALMIGIGTGLVVGAFLRDHLVHSAACRRPPPKPLPPLRLRFGDRFWRPGWVVASNGVAVAYEWNIGDETVRVEAMPRGTNQ